jgi:ribosomal subunit interface protein
MNIDLSARRLEVNQAIHDYVQWRFLPLSHSDMRIRTLRVVLDLDDEHHEGRRYLVEAQTDFGDSMASGAGCGANLHETINQVAEILARELRRFHAAQCIHSASPAAA